MNTPRDDDADRQADDSAESRNDDGLDASEVDARFAELIAGFNDTPWPETEQAKPAAETNAEPEPADQDPNHDQEEPDNEPETKLTNAQGAEPTLLELWDTDLPDDPDEPEDSFTPPPPPPLPRPSVPAILGVVLLIGGLMLVLYPSVLDVGEQLARFTGIAAFVGGAAMLIWRLRPESDEDDHDPGNGAVV